MKTGKERLLCGLLTNSEADDCFIEGSMILKEDLDMGTDKVNDGLCNEIEIKLVRLREYMKSRGLCALLLKRIDNFAWITAGGDNRCVCATDLGVASVLVTQDEQWVLTSSVEGRRLREETLAHIGAGNIFRIEEYPWYREPASVSLALERVASSDGCVGRVGADFPVAGTEFVGDGLFGLRYPFTETEAHRYTRIAQGITEVVERVAEEVRPGQTELSIAGKLSSNLLAAGYYPTVVLVGADLRAKRYRHPFPTMNTVDKYCMIIVCANRGGLTAALTRSVYIGTPDSGLRRHHEAAAYVYAVMNAYTRPGARWVEVMEAMKSEYCAQGFEGEWRHHHQGGPIGYQDREFLVSPEGTSDRDFSYILPLQAVAWNPSVPGAKSEDSLLVRGAGSEVVTVGAGWWPMLDVEIKGAGFQRPDILVL